MDEVRPIPQHRHFGKRSVSQPVVTRINLNSRQLVIRCSITCSGVGNNGFNSLKNTSVHISRSNCSIFRAISSGCKCFTRWIKISGDEKSTTRRLIKTENTTHQLAFLFADQGHFEVRHAFAALNECISPQVHGFLEKF